MKAAARRRVAVEAVVTAADVAAAIAADAAATAVDVAAAAEAAEPSTTRW